MNSPFLAPPLTKPQIPTGLKTTPLRGAAHPPQVTYETSTGDEAYDAYEVHGGSVGSFSTSIQVEVRSLHLGGSKLRGPGCMEKCQARLIHGIPGAVWSIYIDRWILGDWSSWN